MLAASDDKESLSTHLAIGGGGVSFLVKQDSSCASVRAYMEVISGRVMVMCESVTLGPLPDVLHEIVSHLGIADFKLTRTTCDADKTAPGTCRLLLQRSSMPW